MWITGSHPWEHQAMKHIQKSIKNFLVQNKAKHVEVMHQTVNFGESPWPLVIRRVIMALFIRQYSSYGLFNILLDAA